MRSITTKLILAFLVIGIISIAIISITARWNTRQEFISFLEDQNQNNMVSNLTEYYKLNGSWNGVDFIFVQRVDHPPGMGNNPHMPIMQPFTLADPQGYVIVSNGRFEAGERVPENEFDLGIPIEQNNDVIGILIPAHVPFQGNPREVQFIERTNRILLYGVLAGALIALFLGIFLSNSITRPLRELTGAAHAISEGDLAQQVPVRTQDELGELAQAFNKMSTELSRSVNTRKQMTADIAHELRTPLSLILGHAEAVHDGVLLPTKENFEIIREEAVRLEHLVDDLRTLSLADAGELSINLESVEAGRLLQDVASLYQVRAQRKSITIELDVAPHLPTIEVDPGRMTQVLTNIIDNAMRHTPENGRIMLSVKQSSDRIEFSVQDNGPGLPAEEVERIFDRFYRTD
jgi:signal transduction histidine kinase